MQKKALISLCQKAAALAAGLLDEALRDQHLTLSRRMDIWEAIMLVLDNLDASK